MAGTSRAVHPTARQVDHSALRTNQVCIILFLALAFVLNQPWLVAFVCAVMLVGTLVPRAALFQQLYRGVLRPAGLLKPDLRDEAAAPHRFAQGMGGVVLLLALASLLLGAIALGWALALLVIALAAVNLLLGFCAGCFVYFQLQRLGVLKA
jgi:hypothetical protein